MSTAVHGSPRRLPGPLQPRTIEATEEEEGDEEEEEEEEERDEEDDESIGGLGELMGPVPQTWSGKQPTNIKSTGGPEALGGPRRARGAKQATRP